MAAADGAGGTLPQQPSPLCRVVFAMLWMDVLTQLKRSCLHFAYLSSNSSVMQLYKYLSPAYVASSCRYFLVSAGRYKAHACQRCCSLGSPSWLNLCCKTKLLKYGRCQRQLTFPGGMLSML